MKFIHHNNYLKQTLLVLFLLSTQKCSPHFITQFLINYTPSFVKENKVICAFATGVFIGALATTLCYKNFIHTKIKNMHPIPSSPTSNIDRAKKRKKKITTPCMFDNINESCKQLLVDFIQQDISAQYSFIETSKNGSRENATVLFKRAQSERWADMIPIIEEKFSDYNTNHLIVFIFHTHISENALENDSKNQNVSHTDTITFLHVNALKKLVSGDYTYTIPKHKNNLGMRNLFREKLTQIFPESDLTFDMVT